MKVISRKEFQDAYISPTEEQTARMQAALDRLQQEPDEERLPRWTKPRLAFVLIAALLIIGGITAIATSRIRYETTWGGEVKVHEENEDQENPIAFYTETPVVIQVKMKNAREEGLFPCLTGPDQNVTSQYPVEHVESQTKLIAMLDAEGFPHPETLIPENCSFSMGEVTYGIISDYKRTLVDSTTIDGYTLDIYSSEPENKYINGYHVYFSLKDSPSSQYMIIVYSSPVPGFTFYFETDELSANTQTLSVPGMEEALIVRTSESETLYMRQNIASSDAKLVKTLHCNYLIISAAGDVDNVVKMYSDWAK